jgi:hypothetical protein
MRRKRAFNRNRTADYPFPGAQQQQPFTTNAAPFSMKTGWKDWMIILAGLFVRSWSSSSDCLLCQLIESTDTGGRTVSRHIYISTTS